MVTEIDPPASLADDSVTEPDVVVACVTYNSESVIEGFLAALPAALQSVPDCRVVVVDNDSQDDTVDIIRRAAPWVTLVRAPRNLGYAAGINLALAHSLGRSGVYVLNPDAIPAPGSVARLLDLTRLDPGVGIAVPMVRAADGSLKFSLRREPTLMRALGEAVLGGHRAARVSWLGDMIRDPGRYRDGATADWATGAAMFISRSAIDAVGEWDERFFLYSEETDYALRVRDEGFRLELLAGTSVTHPGGEMSTSPHLWSLVAANQQRLYRKRHRLLPSVAYWAVLVAREGVRAMFGRERSRLACRVLLALGPDHAGSTSTVALITRTSVPWHVGRSPGSTPAT